VVGSSDIATRKLSDRRPVAEAGDAVYRGPMTDAASFEIATARMRLVRMSARHLDDLVALDADPEVMRFVGGVSTTREQYVEILPRMMQWNDRLYGFFAALNDGAFAGWFHLRPSVVDDRTLELGYRLRRETWGKGFATEGSRALLRHAFHALGQREVDACAVAENVASTGVMKKCGMRKVGAFIHPRLPVLVDRYLVEREAAILD
jgi:RimJ/RimL family protein N-acetyltransferase